ncbi:hypothetical protein AAH978_08015 [Streptomyces sp. ZYX-F-203]
MDSPTHSTEPADTADSPQAPPPESAGRPEPKPRGTTLSFDDPLEHRSADDTDRGWGEGTGPEATGDLRRFLDEKPPHHL